MHIQNVYINYKYSTYKSNCIEKLQAMQQGYVVYYNEQLMASLVERFFCLGTEVPRHSAGSVGTAVGTAVRTSYVNRIHNQRYCFAHARPYKPIVLQIGNSQCLLKFKDVVRLVRTHYKVQITQLHCGLH